MLFGKLRKKASQDAGGIANTMGGMTSMIGDQIINATRPAIEEAGSQVGGAVGSGAGGLLGAAASAAPEAGGTIGGLLGSIFPGVGNAAGAAAGSALGSAAAVPLGAAATAAPAIGQAVGRFGATPAAMLASRVPQMAMSNAAQGIAGMSPRRVLNQGAQMAAASMANAPQVSSLMPKERWSAPAPTDFGGVPSNTSGLMGTSAHDMPPEVDVDMSASPTVQKDSLQEELMRRRAGNGMPLRSYQ